MPACCTGLCSGTFLSVLLGLALCMAGLAPPYWLKNGSDHIGLWQECKGGSCSNYQDLNDPEWMNATRGLLFLVVIGVIATFILYSCFCCCERCGRSFMIIAQIILTWGCAATVIVAVIVFAEHYDTWGRTAYYNEYEWSFYLTCCSAALFVLGGVIGLAELCCGNRK